MAQRLTPTQEQVRRRAGERQHEEDQGDPARALLDRLIGVDGQLAGHPEGGIHSAGSIPARWTAQRGQSRVDRRDVFGLGTAVI